MGPCYTCGKTVAFGGVKDHGFRFCSKQCRTYKAPQLKALSAISDSSVEAEALRIREGACARCGEQGGVDIQKSAFVWSAIIITKMKEDKFVGCAKCARKAQAKASLGTLLVGWWGIPFGIIATPTAIVINLVLMLTSGTKAHPSKNLKSYARERLAWSSSRPASGIEDIWGQRDKK